MKIAASRFLGWNELALFVTAFAGIVLLPMMAGAIWIKVFTSAVIFAIAASGAALVYGRLGLVNLAQVALVGVGGWIMLRLNYATTFPFEVALVLSALGTGLVGMLLALPALRMRGLYLALVTLMAAVRSRSSSTPSSSPMAAMDSGASPCNRPERCVVRYSHRPIRPISVMSSLSPPFASSLSGFMRRPAPGAPGR